MRILITGANGQVGHELLRVLQDCGGVSHAPSPSPVGERETNARRLAGEDRAVCEIIPATRGGELEDGTPCERIDLADFDRLAETLDHLKPHLIINAAAYTAVDRAEDEPELAMRVNREAVGALGRWAARHEARVVHYSTDYVFSGDATRPYREDDAPCPVSVYGRSKLAGEVALRDSGARHLIFRTAWVYAARGKNFLGTMLRLGAERAELRVVDDQIGAPTSAGLIADVTARALARWYGRDEETSKKFDDTYHLVASGQTSWCGFARAIFERAQRAGLIARAPQVAAIRTADYPTKAKRPAYSVLDTARLRNTFGLELPDWQTALDQVIGEM